MINRGLSGIMVVNRKLYDFFVVQNLGDNVANNNGQTTTCVDGFEHF